MNYSLILAVYLSESFLIFSFSDSGNATHSPVPKSTYSLKSGVKNNTLESSEEIKELSTMFLTPSLDLSTQYFVPKPIRVL